MSGLTDRFADDLSRCTARIVTANGFGTGFFVSPQRMLTCAHVVSPKAGGAGDMNVEWRGSKYPATIKLIAPALVPERDIYPDLAILDVPIERHPSMALDEDFRVGDTVYVYGYSDNNPNGVGTTAVVEGEVNYGEGDDQRLMKFKDGQFRPGLSGSPIFNMRTKRVCGVLKRTRGRNTALGGEGVGSRPYVDAASYGADSSSAAASFPR